VLLCSFGSVATPPAAPAYPTTIAIIVIHSSYQNHVLVAPRRTSFATSALTLPPSGFESDMQQATHTTKTVC